MPRRRQHSPLRVLPNDRPVGHLAKGCERCDREASEGSPQSPLGLCRDDPFRLSVAGAQEQTALLWQHLSGEERHDSATKANDGLICLIEGELLVETRAVPGFVVENGMAGEAVGLTRQLGLSSATAIVIGQVIAVGIFLGAAAMARSLGSPWKVFAVWAAMGRLFYLCGRAVSRAVGGCSVRLSPATIAAARLPGPGLSRDADLLPAAACGSTRSPFSGQPRPGSGRCILVALEALRFHGPSGRQTPSPDFHSGAIQFDQGGDIEEPRRLTSGTARCSIADVIRAADGVARSVGESVLGLCGSVRYVPDRDGMRRESAGEAEVIDLKLLVRFGVVWTLLAFVACSGSRTEHSVVVYTSVDQIYAEPVLRDFESRSGVRVRAVYDVEASKTTGLVNRIIAEQSQPRADVFWNGEFAQTLVLAERGALAAYRPPAAADLSDLYADPGGLWTGLGARFRVLLVNAGLIGDRPAPKSIFDLLDPAWPADRIGLARPLFGTTATHAAALYAALGRAKAHDFFSRVEARGVRVLDGNSTVRDLVVAGELIWGLTDSDDACAAIRRGAAVRVVVPDQQELGTLLIPGTVAVVSGGPNPDEARRIVDFLLSPEAENRLLESGFFQLSLRNLKLLPGCMPADQEVKPMDASLPDIERNFPISQNELREVFLR